MWRIGIKMMSAIEKIWCRIWDVSGSELGLALFSNRLPPVSGQTGWGTHQPAIALHATHKKISFLRPPPRPLYCRTRHVVPAQRPHTCTTVQKKIQGPLCPPVDNGRPFGGWKDSHLSHWWVMWPLIVWVYNHATLTSDRAVGIIFTSPMFSYE